MARWRRTRQFLVVVVEDLSAPPASADSAPGSDTDNAELQQQPHRHPSRLAACVTLTLTQPEAILPPPFPSGKPYRAYVGNMAVLPQHRRRGLAQQLLARCERLGEWWVEGVG